MKFSPYDVIVSGRKDFGWCIRFRASAIAYVKNIDDVDAIVALHMAGRLA